MLTMTTTCCLLLQILLLLTFLLVGTFTGNIGMHMPPLKVAFVGNDGMGYGDAFRTGSFGNGTGAGGGDGIHRATGGIEKTMW